MAGISISMNETTKAFNLLKATVAQAEKMASDEANLETGFAHLGFLILESVEMQYWRVQFENFRQYLESISKVSKKSVPQLKQYFLTARDLSDSFSREQLESMGITKALRLLKAKRYTQTIPPDIAAAALDPTITAAELKKKIQLKFNMPKDDPGADWFELGFIVTPEEHTLILDTLRVMRRVDPMTSEALDEEAQNKDAFMKMCLECLGTYGEHE